MPSRGYDLADKLNSPLEYEGLYVDLGVAVGLDIFLFDNPEISTVNERLIGNVSVI